MISALLRPGGKGFLRRRRFYCGGVASGYGSYRNAGGPLQPASFSRTLLEAARSASRFTVFV